MDPLVDLIRELVAIDSVNPDLVPGAPGEARLAAFVADWLRGAGGAADVIEAPVAGRPSVLARAAGSGSGPGIVLYAHLDTVGVDGMDAPFTPRVDGGCLHGRGAYDMKASLAACMQVFAQAVAAPGGGDVWLMCPSDEENGSLGAQAVLAELSRRGARPAGAIVTEPSDLRVMPAHRGFATGTITTRGVAAHTARRDQGVDAIAMAARIVCELEDLDAQFNTEPPHALLGNRAVVASMIHGGSETFTYPAQCALRFVWRTLPGDTPQALIAEMQRVFARLRARDPRFDARLELALWREALETGLDAPIARVVSDAARHVLGAPPAVAGAPWWTDAALIQAAGIPAVIIGPRGGGIHAVDEWVDVESARQLAAILEQATRSFCNANQH